MIGPPDGGIPSMLLAAARILGYLVTTTAPDGTPLGVFQGTAADGSMITRPLYLVAGDAPGTCAWRTADAPPPGVLAFLFSRRTYDVLHAGTLASDGSIVYQGACYRVRAMSNGAQLVAEAVATTGAGG